MSTFQIIAEMGNKISRILKRLFDYPIKRKPICFYRQEDFSSTGIVTFNINNLWGTSKTDILRTLSDFDRWTAPERRTRSSRAAHRIWQTRCGLLQQAARAETPQQRERGEEQAAEPAEGDGPFSRVERAHHFEPPQLVHAVRPKPERDAKFRRLVSTIKKHNRISRAVVCLQLGRAGKFGRRELEWFPETEIRRGR